MSGVGVGQAEHPGDHRDRQQAREVAEQLEGLATGQPGKAIDHERADRGDGERRDRVRTPLVRHRPVEDLVLRPDQRPEIAPSDDPRGFRQRASRLLEEVLPTLDEGAAVVRDDKPRPHPLVPDDRSDGAGRLVGGIRIDISHVPKRDGRQGSRRRRHTITASMPR